MARKADVNILSKITGEFDLLKVKNGKWNIVQLDRHVTSQGFETVFNFLVQLGLFPLKQNCPSCQKELRLAVDGKPESKFPIVYRCYNSKCKKTQVAVRKNTWFEQSNISFEKILLIIICF